MKSSLLRIRKALRIHRRQWQAYRLMGLFGVNMPLLYGERRNFFRRLQEDIIRQVNDQTLLLWHVNVIGGDDLGDDVFATSPDSFKLSSQLKTLPEHCFGSSERFDITPRGLHAQLPFIESGGRQYAIFACRYRDNLCGPIGLEIGFNNEHFGQCWIYHGRRALVFDSQLFDFSTTLRHVNFKGRLDFNDMLLQLEHPHPSCLVRVSTAAMFHMKLRCTVSARLDKNEVLGSFTLQTILPEAVPNHERRAYVVF
jgi:hypothetical protein